MDKFMRGKKFSQQEKNLTTPIIQEETDKVDTHKKNTNKPQNSQPKQFYR